MQEQAVSDLSPSMEAPPMMAPEDNNLSDAHPVIELTEEDKEWLNSGDDEQEPQVQAAAEEKPKERTRGDILRVQEELLAPLNEGQLAAVKKALSAPKGMFLITGHAGTGKSFVLRTILRLIENQQPNEKVLCLAPTHQALDQIAHVKASNCVKGTVASHFGVSAVYDKDSGKEEFSDPDMRRCDAAYIAVDEVFMVGEKEALLFAEQAKKSRVIFLGDKAQLPPVNKKSVDYEEFVGKDNVAVLTEQCRNGDYILKLCEHFRKKTTIPAKSMGAVSIYSSRRSFEKEFIKTVESDPIPGDNVYLAFTNKKMREVRSKIKKHIYNNEDYPLGQWVRMEGANESVGLGGKVRSIRYNFVGRIVDREETTIDLLGREWKAYVLTLENREGELLSHEKAISPEGKHVIHPTNTKFLTLSFDDLDSLEVELKEWFNSNRELSKRIKSMERRGARHTLEYETAVLDHTRGVALVLQAQKLSVALSPYSYTVHKSQGMSIKNIFLDAANILLYDFVTIKKELLYVGASRASESLHVLR